jgi:Vitamin B6 photo-protection and homoeostasis
MLIKVVSLLGFLSSSTVFSYANPKNPVHQMYQNALTSVGLEFDEICGLTKSRIRILPNGMVERESIRQSHNKWTGLYTYVRLKFLGRLSATFLPLDYPASVPPEYLTFQAYNVVQDFCSYLRGVMSTQAILEGMGVGRTDITALQATVNWVIRDGASMIGSLLFTSFSSAKFGQNVKSWRYFADFINNVGITLEVLAPLSRMAFLPVLCLASVCKALCGVSAGASGAAINEHWGSKRGNIADVLSKNGAQHTIVSLVGLFLSIPFARFANSSRRHIWIIYSLLTSLHMYTNYKAMKILALRSINETRLRILLDLFFSSQPVTRYLEDEFESFKSSGMLFFVLFVSYQQ